MIETLDCQFILTCVEAHASEKRQALEDSCSAVGTMEPTQKIPAMGDAGKGQSKAAPPCRRTQHREDERSNQSGAGTDDQENGEPGQRLRRTARRAPLLHLAAGAADRWSRTD
jgi:hypothetical protein